MAIKIYASALNELQTSLDEIERYFDFVILGNQLRPWLGKMVSWSTLEKEHTRLLQSFMSNKDYNVSVGYNVLIVAVGASVEHFVRRMIRDAVTWINTKYDHYAKMPNTLRNQNLIRSGRALVTVADPPVELAYDYELMCKNLGTCWSDGGTLVLNADAFAVGVTNVNKSRIDDVFKKVGIELNWDVFGRDSGLATHFATKVGRDTAAEVIKYLGQFVHLRNRVAHSGQGIQSTESDVRIAISFFSKFGNLLANAIEGELKKAHP